MLFITTIRSISEILIIFLPNILIGFSIGVLIIGVINQVYLYNYLKLLAVQAEVRNNRQQVAVLTHNMTKLVAHQPTVEHLTQLLGAQEIIERDEQRLISEEQLEDTQTMHHKAYRQQQVDLANQLLSQQQVDQMLSELQLSQQLDCTPAVQVLNKLQKLQFETALFFKNQLVDEQGLVSFETPLADEPDKARQVAQISTVQTLRQMRLIAQKEQLFDRRMQSKFLDFVTLYENVVISMIQVNNKSSVRLEELLRTYQTKISELLSIQAVEDYQYDTYQYWVDWLEKNVAYQIEEE